MEEQIIELLNKRNKALSVHEICEELNYQGVDNLKKVMVILNYLEDNLKIRRTNKDNYETFKNKNVKIGTLLGTKKNYAFVDIEGNDDVFIPPTCLNGAVDGDKVIVEITSKKGVDLEGRIVRIVQRNMRNLVGTVILDGNVKKLKLDNEKLKLNILITDENAMPGHKVLVKPTTKLKDNTYQCEVLRILGHINDPGVDILSIVCEHDFPDAFSEEAMKEVEQIPGSLSETEISNRLNNDGIDLRNHMIFTIDGDDTKDIDDAVEVQKLENGNYYLGVHIADVSYYVKPGMKVYEEAYTRGTSVYLADRVIPMLPHKLSNGICSLNPGEDRFALSCMVEIDPSGKILSTDIKESVIRSRKQMTYKCVNSILEKNEIPSGYEEFADTLKVMQELASILRKNKEARGYIDFDIDEAKIIVDENGKAIDVVLRERGTGEKLIEDFMIAANEAVATYINYMQLPFVYRVHDKPSEEKVTNFISFVNSLGYVIKEKIRNMTPIEMQKLLASLKDVKEYPILSSLMLRSMRKAIYDTTNIGHFGLGSECYTHFTSPIRRFPDTTVHRLLRTYLFKHQMDSTYLSQLEAELKVICEHSSERERAAIDCEREVDDMKMAEYMLDHIGEQYSGMISSITSFGMFVELPNLIEGLIRMEELKDDYYIFDESTMSLIGKKNKRGYRLGDEMDVIVSAANKEARTIDFVPATEDNIKKYVKEKKND